jgi:hypothetical protein
MTPNWFSVAAFACLIVLSGCGSHQSAAPASKTDAKAPPTESKQEADEVAVERAKLKPDDRALVESQEWCVVNEEGRLGSMGAPVKLSIKGQPVFLCCAGCKRKAEADPDKTLAKLEEHKAKAQKSAKKSG